MLHAALIEKRYRKSLETAAPPDSERGMGSHPPRIERKRSPVLGDSFINAQHHNENRRHRQTNSPRPLQACPRAGVDSLLAISQPSL